MRHPNGTPNRWQKSNREFYSRKRKTFCRQNPELPSNEKFRIQYLGFRRSEGRVREVACRQSPVPILVQDPLMSSKKCQPKSLSVAPAYMYVRSLPLEVMAMWRCYHVELCAWIKLLRRFVCGCRCLPLMAWSESACLMWLPQSPPSDTIRTVQSVIKVKRGNQVWLRPIWRAMGVFG